MKSHPTKQLGFSLVEMIVSLGLFAIVVTVSVGALLVLIATNEQLQSEQSVMTNLSFALDSMAREIRTGTEYYCVSRPNYNSGGGEAVFDVSDDQDDVLGDETDDCYTGNNNGHRLQGISFKEGGNSITGTAERILYFYDGDLDEDTGGKIYRRVGDEDAQSIVSSGIYITDAEFYVSGSHPLGGTAPDPDDDNQATVTIFIEAKESKSADKSYRIQTTITQRTLDI